MSNYDNYDRTNNIKKYQAMYNYIKTKINITESPNFMLNYIGDILNKLKEEKPYLIGTVRNLIVEIEKLPNEEEKQKLLKMINSKYNEMSVTSPISDTAVTYLNLPPIKEQVYTSTEVVTKFEEIGLSTRPGGYDKNPRAWINILFEYRLNKKIEQLLKIKKWEDCQFIIGFEIPKEATTSEGLTYLDPLNILLRLDKLATNNIVAISELIRSGDTMVVEEKLPGKKIYNCVVDVGFVTNKTISNFNDVGIMPSETKQKKEERELAERKSVLEYSKLKILNIHLPSDGPKQKSISDFISGELEKYKIADKQDINVICGDTNITINKCDPEKTRSEIGQEIAKTLNSFFVLDNELQEWIVLMSSHEIEKTRHGFILRNQQIGKSTPQNKKDIDADGTILAIKVYKKNKKSNATAIITDWMKELKLNSDVTADYVFSNSTTTITMGDKDIVSEGKALWFKNSHAMATNDKNEPTEKIFIDHSVLYSKLSLLEKYVSPDPDMTEPPGSNNENLIVLNLGSMVNAGNKNWNLVHREKLEQIKILDKKLYEIFKKNNVFYNKDDKTPLEESYENFAGKNKLYNTNITVDQECNILKAIDNMTLTLEIAQPTSSGGRKSRKLRKSRKPRKSRKLRKSRKSRKLRRR